MFTIEVRSDHNVTTGRQAALQEGTVCCTQLHKNPHPTIVRRFEILQGSHTEETRK